MHWADWNAGVGPLFSGDTLQVTNDRKVVGFMYGYPNLIPLDAATVRRLAGAVAPFRLDRLYGGLWQRDIRSGAAAAVARSGGDRLKHRLF